MGAQNSPPTSAGNETGPAPKAQANDRGRLIFAVSGLLGSTLLVARLAPQFELGTDVVQRPIGWVVGLLLAAFAFYLMAIPSLVRLSSRKSTVWWIWGIALVLRGVTLPTAPIQEVDIYRYIWDGWVVSHGVNPFVYSPRTVQRAEAQGADPVLVDLVRQIDGEPSMRDVLARVHYPEFSTVYPTVSQFVFGVAAWATPFDADLLTRRLLMKLVLVLFDVGALWILVRWLAYVARPVGYAALYGWCPLVIKEFANSGHLDSIAVFFSVAAMYGLVRSVAFGTSTLTRPKRVGTRFRLGSVWPLASVVLLALGVGAKLYPVVLSPVVLATIQRRYGWKMASIAGLTFAMVVAALFAPLWGHPQSLNNDWGAASASDSPASVAVSIPPPGSNESPATVELEMANPSGFSAFFRYWEMNDFIFMLVVENLKPREEAAAPADHWFVLMPNALRHRLIEPITRRTGVMADEAAFLMTRVFLALTCMAIAIWLIASMRERRPGTGVSMGRLAFYTVAWFWLLQPTQNPWYWTWAVAFLPFVDRRIWWWMSGCVLLYYLRFWFDYQFGGHEVLGTGYRGAAFFDFVLTWVEYGPWFAALAITAWLRRRRRQHEPFASQP